MVTQTSDRAIELLADEYAKEILAQLSRERLSASELSERCDASESTVYERLDELEEVGLINEHLRVDSDGHHHNVYSARVDAVRIQIEDGEYTIRLQTVEDPADRMAQMWREVRRR